MHASKTVRWNFGNEDDSDLAPRGGWTTSFSESRQGGWEITATATETTAGTVSVLARRPIPDGGIWDLCEILTFVTGRRVTTLEQTHRRDPNKYGANACVPVEALHAAAVAWQHREEIVQRKLTFALVMHNEALEFEMLQVVAGLNNIALNVLVDGWRCKSSGLAPEVKKAVKAAVTCALEGIADLTVNQRQGLEAILGSTIDRGIGSSMHDKTMELLVDLDVIPSGSEPEVEERVRFMNAVRNRIVHSGQLPTLKHLDQEQSERYGCAIAVGVAPEITRLALGRLLGFQPRGLGSRSQDISDLQSFFQKGVWRGWPLERQSFEDWFYADISSEGAG
jgi:hypothetical protein